MKDKDELLAIISAAENLGVKKKDELRHLLRNRLQVISGFVEDCAGSLMPMHINKAFEKIIKEIETLSEELGKYGL